VKPFILPTLSYADEIVADAAATPWSAPLVAAQNMLASGGVDLDVLLQASVASALDIVAGASGALVALGTDGALLCRAASGSCAPLLGRKLPLDPFHARCLGEGRLLYCSDPASDDRVDASACLAQNIRSLLLVPLPYAGEKVGVLALHASEPDAFDMRDRLAAQLLAGPIALGLAAMPATGSAETRAAAPLLAESFGQAAIGLARTGPDGDFLLVNDLFCAIAGRRRETLLAARVQDILHAEDYAAQLGLAQGLVEGTLGHYEIEARCLRPGGAEYWVKLLVSLVRDQAGAPVGFVFAAVDLDSAKRAEAGELHDPLTGLLNTKGLGARLERELDRAANDGKPLTLALIELEGFETLQAELGWGEGRRCLQGIGRALARACRPGDAVAQVDQRFVRVMPGLERTPASATLKRVRSAVARLARAEAWPIRAALGAASRLRDGSTAESLIAAAARRMEESKGRTEG
jgi:diguanylate cyclase (GGDEF)-like protein/PAS domain S-box-containing protein